MPASVKVSGAWKTVSAISVKVGGAWKAVNAAYVRVGGVWKSWGSSPKYVVTVSDTSPYIDAYQFSSGWGAKFSAPAANAGGGTRGIAFNPAKTVVAAGFGASPYIHAWAWSGAGFGSKYAAPGGTVPGWPMQDVTWSPNGNTVLVSGNAASNPLNAYNWSGGFGTRYANPSQAPTGTDGAVGWAPGSNYVIVPGNYGQWASAYNFSGGWGTKLTENYNFTNSNYSMEFIAAGNVVFSGNQASPYVFAHAWSGGWGSKYANPATLPAGNIVSLVASPAQNSVVTSRGQGWAWSGGWGSKYADVTLSSASMAFMSDGSTVFARTTSSPFVHAWPWSPGFGTKYANPATLPAAHSGQIGHQIAST